MFGWVKIWLHKWLKMQILLFKLSKEDAEIQDQVLLEQPQLR